MQSHFQCYLRMDMPGFWIVGVCKTSLQIRQSYSSIFQIRTLLGFDRSAAIRIPVSTYGTKEVGHKSKFLNNMTVPDSFSFPNMETVIGKVEFQEGSGDPAGCVGELMDDVFNVDEIKLAATGWTPISDMIDGAKNSNKIIIASTVSLVVLLTVAGGLSLIIMHVRLKSHAKRLEDAEKELENVANLVPKSPKFEIEGAGTKALELLMALKNGNLRKRGHFTTADFNFLIEVYASGGAGTFLPTLLNQESKGGVAIDDETRAFVLGSMLTAPVKPRAAVEPLPEAEEEEESESKDTTTSEVRRDTSSASKKSRRLGRATSKQSLDTDNSSNSRGHAVNIPSSWESGNRRTSVSRAVSKRHSSRRMSFASAEGDEESDDSNTSHPEGQRQQRESLSNAIPESGMLEASRSQITGSEIGTEMRQPSGSFGRKPHLDKKSTPLDIKYKLIKELLYPVTDISTIKTEVAHEYLDQQYMTWNLDIFHLTELTGGHPLYFSGSWLFNKLGLLPTFKIDPEAFKKWLWLMESDTHASRYTELEKLAGLIAAIGHDIDHPGYTNQFLIKSRHPMAIMYSDSSVNEFHHSAHLFEKTQKSTVNIFSGLSVDEYDEIRRNIIRLVLCTDMSRHFEYLTKFKTKLQTGGVRLDTQENRIMVMEIAIKCSDLNNPSKAPQLALRWVQCIMEEFYCQGDAERELGLPISQFMDRNNPNVPK
ncbi:cAMP-specific 3',5'-cyclic phosphodiesterase 4D, partial [Blyttiomyces sp. JEL0837]